MHFDQFAVGLSASGNLDPEYFAEAKGGGQLPKRREQRSEDYESPYGDQERIRAAVKIPAFLPYYDTLQTAGETAEMRAAYRRMVADPYVKAAWLKKILGVGATDLSIKPPKSKRKSPRHQKIADFVDWNLKRGIAGGSPGMVWEIFSGGTIDGYSICEPLWGDPENAGPWKGKRRLARLKAKDVDQDLVPYLDEFKNVTSIKGLRYNSGEEWNPKDFVIYSHLGLYGNPTGMSDFRAVYRAYWLLDTAWKLRAIAVDKRSMPIVIGHWTDPQHQSKLENALAKIRYQNWMAVPESARVEVLDIAGQSHQIFSEMIRDLREEVAIGINGAMLQMMSSTGQRGDSQVHKDTTDLGIWHLSNAFCNVLNDHESGLIRRVVDLNFSGVDEYPVASAGGVDDAELGESVRVDQGLQQIIAPMGLDLDREELEERYGRKFIEKPMQPGVVGPDGQPIPAQPGGMPGQPGAPTPGTPGQPAPGGAPAPGEPAPQDAIAGDNPSGPPVPDGHSGDGANRNPVMAGGDQGEGNDEKHKLIAEILGSLPGDDQSQTFAEEIGQLIPEMATFELRPPREFSSTQFDLFDGGYSRSQGNPAETLIEMAAAIPDSDLAEKGRELNPHVTVKFGLHTNSIEDIERIVKDFGPIGITFGKTSVFPATEGRDYDVIKVDVDSPKLHALNKLIAESTECTDAHPEYCPHVTIAYVKAGLGDKYAAAVNVDGQMLLLSLLVFSDKHRNGLGVSLLPERTWQFSEFPDLELFAETDWTHDPTQRTQNRWVNNKTGRRVYSSTNPGAPKAKQSAAGKTGGTAPGEPKPKAPTREQAHSAAKEKIAEILAGKSSPGAHQELLGHLSALTIPQLKQLRDEHGLKATGKLKADLVGKIGGHFKQKMLARGSVDLPKLRDTLKPFHDVELSPEDTHRTRGDYNAKKSQYGTLLLHRIKEEADEHIEEMDDLPKGAKQDRLRHQKQLASLAWMADKATKDGIDGKIEEPSLKDLSANLDRIGLAERLKGVPWSAFLLKSIRDRFGVQDRQNDEQIFHDLKEGKYKGPQLDDALRSLRTDYGTVTQSQLFDDVLPALKSRKDTVRDTVHAEKSMTAPVVRATKAESGQKAIPAPAAAHATKDAAIEGGSSPDALPSDKPNPDPEQHQQAVAKDATPSNEQMPAEKRPGGVVDTGAKTIEPHPKQNAQPANPKDDGKIAERDRTIAAVHKVIDAATAHKGLDPKRAAHYKQAMKGIAESMSDTALTHLANGMKDVHFSPTGNDASMSALKAVIDSEHSSPKSKQDAQQRFDAIASGKRKSGGCYYTRGQKLFLNGPQKEFAMAGKHGGKGLGTHEVYAHEMTHAIDGPTHQFSNSKDWSVAWTGEIGGPNKDSLTHYAATKLSEGFAEFGRLVYGGNSTLATIEKDFPKASAFFKSNDLWPKSRPWESGKPIQDIFDKDKKIEFGEGGKDGHIDILHAPKRAAGKGNSDPTAKMAEALESSAK